MGNLLLTLAFMVVIDAPSRSRASPASC